MYTIHSSDILGCGDASGEDNIVIINKYLVPIYLNYTKS